MELVGEQHETGRPDAGPLAARQPRRSSVTGNDQPCAARSYRHPRCRRRIRDRSSPWRRTLGTENPARQAGAVAGADDSIFVRQKARARRRVAVRILFKIARTELHSCTSWPSCPMHCQSKRPWRMAEECRLGSEIDEGVDDAPDPIDGTRIGYLYLDR